MNANCRICNEMFDGDADSFECDGCTTVFHMNCVGVTKAAIIARSKSAYLRIYCCDCINSKETMLNDNIKTVMKYLQKIDLVTQKQEIKFADIEKEMKNISTNANTNTTVLQHYNINGQNDKNMTSNITSSYAAAVKRNVKPVVVIKPKKQQNSKVTLDKFTSNVNKSELNVCSTRNARNGGIVLCCDNDNESMKVKQIVKDKLGDNYEVNLPTIKKPRLRITNIDIEIPNERIIAELKKHNEILKGIDLKMITVIQRKMRNKSSNDIIVELNSDAYKTLKSVGMLRLPWRECNVYDHLYIKRCFKCCGFSHNSTECNKEQKCSKCSGNHKYAECKTNKLNCINCKFENEKYKLTLDTKHHAWSKTCSILQRRMLKLQNTIQYNEMK